MRAPARAGSYGRSSRGLISVAVSVLIVALVVVGGLSALTTVPAPTVPAGPSHLTAAAPPVTHGDLVVSSGELFVIQPTPGTHMSYQGGNITVERGGTLLIRNVTLSFVQFVSDAGTPIQRLSHIYHFIDNGTVNVYNSTVTTDVQVINAYAKLNVTILDSMTAWNSTFAFPGWVNVEGASASLTLNDSRVTANPAVAGLMEPTTIIGDTMWAPSIIVTGGAELNAFNSYVNRTYADDLLTYNEPAPVPLGLPGYPNVLVPLTGDHDFTQLSTPNDSANLTQDWLYPNADFQAGYLEVAWNNPSLTPASVNAYVWYDGTKYTVATALPFLNSSGGTFSLDLAHDAPTLLSAITQDGVLSYLNWTGDFGVTPSRIAVELNEVSGPAVVNVSADLLLLPSLDYNIGVSGAGSTLNSIDTSFDVNWNAPPSSSTSLSAPLPWNSNKLLLTDGAVAYLANATVQSPLPGVFSHSAVLPDASSQAFFYRWAQFNLTGRGGFLPIPDAKVSAFYAYTGGQTDNLTTNALNDLATSNPAIWGYVQYLGRPARRCRVWRVERVGHGLPPTGVLERDRRDPAGRILPRRVPRGGRRPRSRGRKPLVQLVGQSVPRGRCTGAARRSGTGLWSFSAVPAVLRCGGHRLCHAARQRSRGHDHQSRPDPRRPAGRRGHRHCADRPGQQ